MTPRVLLHDDGQPDTAEGVASQVINNFPGEQFQVCDCHRVLGNIRYSRGETEKAIDHFRTALKIASSFNWDIQLLWVHCDLAELFSNKDRFGDALVHIEHAKSHAVDNVYGLGRVMRLQAWFWYRQQKFKEARSAVSHAADIFKRLGATEGIEGCRALLEMIEQAMKRQV